jgi:ankyrin repeat protein/beta-lactamase regulating signal transducer with metallopeptidase domain
MYSTLMSFASGLTDYLLYASIIAAVLVTIAWSIIKLGRVKAPVYNHMIWLCTLFAVLVLPVVFLYAPKVAVPVLPAHPKTIIALTQRNITYASSGIIEERLLDLQPSGPSATALPSESHGKLLALISLKNILACLWTIGFLFMLVRFLIDWHRIKRIMRLAEPLPGDLLPRDIFPTRLKLLLSAQIGGPLCLGFYRPVILLPKKMCSNGISEDLMMVLGHELAHVERRDWLVNIFQRIIEAILFFHPLVWYASAQLSHEREILCDHHVLAKGVSPTDYIEMLTKVLEQGFERNSLNAVALFEGKNLLSRVRTLLKTGNKTQLKASRIALITSVMIILLFMALGTIRLEAKSSTNIDDNFVPAQINKNNLPVGNCSISGKVVSSETGEPIDDAEVFLFYTKTFDSIFFKTKSDGTFELKDITTGPFSLSANAEGFKKVCYDPDNKSSGDVAFFTLEDNEKRTGVILQLKPAGYSISGKILDEDGQAPKNKRLYVSALIKLDVREGNFNAYKNAGKSSMSYVASDGSYFIDGLDNSPVYIKVTEYESEDPSEAVCFYYYPGTLSRSHANMVYFGKDKSVKNVNIRLTKQGGFSLEGVIKDDNTGKPVSKTLVTAHLRDMLFGYLTAYTDDNGNYHINNLSDGEYFVHVDAEPWGYVRTHKSLKIEDKRSTRLDFSLRQSAVISGNFIDENGKPFEIADRSYGLAFKYGYPHPETMEWTGTMNKYSEKGMSAGNSYNTFNGDQGDYEEEYMVFPTANTFHIQGMLPGKTMLRFYPKDEGAIVKHIFYNGQDIKETGIETLPGEKIRGVSIVIEVGKKETTPDKKETTSDKDAKLIDASVKGDLAAVIAAVTNGANANAKDTKDGRTVLMAASAEGYTDIVRLLLDQGADVSAKWDWDIGGITALWMATLNGHVDVVKLLLEKGADLNAKNSNGETALFIASRQGYGDIVKVFLDRGADVNIRNTSRETALHLASQHGHADVVKLLLDKGAEVNVKMTINNVEWTALKFAKKQGHTDVVQVLEKAGAKEEVSSDKKEKSPDNDVNLNIPNDKNQYRKKMGERLADINDLYGSTFSELGITEEKMNVLADILTDEEWASKDVYDQFWKTNPFKKSEDEKDQITQRSGNIYDEYQNKTYHLLGENAYYQFQTIYGKVVQIDLSNRFNDVLSEDEKLTKEQQRQWIDAMHKSFIKAIIEPSVETEIKGEDLNGIRNQFKNTQGKQLDGYLDCAKTVLSPSQLKQFELFINRERKGYEEFIEQKIKSWQNTEPQPST